MEQITKNEAQASGCSRTCSACKVAMHASYFGLRSDRPGHRLSTCKACMRERWVRWSRKRRGVKGRLGLILTGDTQSVAQAIAAAASRLGPMDSGVKVCRMPDGVVRCWRGALSLPKGAEMIGLYDFEARAEYIAEDLAA